MTQIELNKTDKDNLKADIKLTMMFAAIFLMALVVIVGLIPFTMYIIGKIPSYGFVTRGSYILGLLFVPFIFVSRINLLKFIDLKRGKKIRFETSRYHIQKKRDSFIILTSEPCKMKFEVYSDPGSSLDHSLPVTIEFVPTSKTLLFISNAKIN